MFKFEAAFKTPQGVIVYEIEALNFVDAMSKIRSNNPELKLAYQPIYIRKGIKNETKPDIHRCGA